MVFIDRDGRVLNHRPWSLSRIIEIFTALWFVLVQFFLTLVAPFRRDNNTSDKKRSNGNRSNGWGPSGGGGGGGNSGGSGSSGSGGSSGLRPNRRIGRVVNTSMDCNIPGGG